MKTIFATKPLLFRPIFCPAFMLRRALPIVSMLLFASAGISQTFNPGPDEPDCVEFTINQPVASKTDGPDPDVKIALDGTAEATITVSYTPSEECDGGASGSVEARPDEGNGTTKSQGFDLTESNTSVDLVFSFNAADMAASESWTFYLISDEGESEIDGISFEETCLDTCSPDGSCSGYIAQGCFLATLATHDSNGGMTQGTLYFYTPDFSFPGREGITAIMPSDFEVTYVNDLISQIDTGAGVMDFQDGPGPESFTITYKNAAGAVFRVTTLSRHVIEGNQVLRLDTTFDGTTFRYEQAEAGTHTTILKEGIVVNGVFQALRCETLHEDTSVAGIEVKRRTIEERALATDPWQTVSDVQETWENQIEGWVKTREIVDPDGEALTSTWTYYQPGEITGPLASTEGLGELKQYVRYDGFTSYHTYALHYESVTTPYADDPAGKTVTTTHDPSTNTTTVITTVDGQVISRNVTRTIVSATEHKKIRDVYTSDSEKLTTTTHYKIQGADFIHQPIKVEHPDGTLTTYNYTRDTGGGYTTVMENGATVDGNTVSRGKRRTTSTNSLGTTILSKTESIGYGAQSVVTDLYAVTSVDNLGRALVTAYYPDAASVTGDQASATNPEWETTVVYSCCGVSQETDKYGITTYYAYDSLQRRIKSNRLGITMETVRNGLTTDTHRYPETVSASLSSTLAGTPGDLIGRSVRNLTGTLRESWSPDPTSTTGGALVKTSSSVTTYQPATGLSRRVVETSAEGFSQTTDSFLDGRTASTSGDLSPAMVYSYDVNATGPSTTRSYDDAGTLRETTTTQSDWAGRMVATTFMDGSIASMTYNSLGQRTSSTDPDGIVTLYAYDDEGDLVQTAIDMDQDGIIETGASDQDRVSETEQLLVASRTYEGATYDVSRRISKVWTDTGLVTTSISDRSFDGRRSWSESFGQITYSETVDTDVTDGDWTMKSIRPNGSYSVQTYTDGRLEKTEMFDSTDSLLASTTITYDSLGRQSTVTDSRTGTTTLTYYDNDAIESMIAPDPDGTGPLGTLMTQHIYDIMGRQVQIIHPDASSTYSVYDSEGQLIKTYGSLQNPVDYTYDYAGRQKTMTTWQDFDESNGTGISGSAVTTWIYDNERGWLTRKEYDDGNGTDYTYTPGGRLASRTWARGIVTNYAYNTAGDLLAVDYLDAGATPDVLYSYTRTGQKDEVVDGQFATSPFTAGQILSSGPILNTTDYTYDYAYNDRLQIKAETVKDLLTNDTVLTRIYQDGTEVDGSNNNVGLIGRAEGYDLSVSSANSAVNYTYDTAGRLHTVSNGSYDLIDGSYVFTNGSDTFTYAYLDDTRNLLETMTGPVHTTTYAYESGRNAMTAVDNQLAGGSSSVSTYTYTYNELGQRDTRSQSGSAIANASTDDFEYDELGQIDFVLNDHYSSSDYNPDYNFDDIGNRTGDNIYLSGTTAYTPDLLNQYDSVGGVLYDDPDNNKGYDLDGNFLGDGNWAYTWNGENRLINADNGTLSIDFEYDYQGRLVKKDDGTNVEVYIYDGWNRIATFRSQASGFSLLKTYLWGMDLSGSMQGAGGVGGLLKEGDLYPTYDANGNIVQKLNSSGVASMAVEYDPFGNIISGTLVGEYGFSTKPLIGSILMYYYGFRYYDPVTGRWPSRDPIEERGGLNLYVFVGNDPVNAWDVLGQYESSNNYRRGRIRYRDDFRSRSTSIGIQIDGSVALIEAEGEFGTDVWLLPSLRNPSPYGRRRETLIQQKDQTTWSAKMLIACVCVKDEDLNENVPRLQVSYDQIDDSVAVIPPVTTGLSLPLPFRLGASVTRTGVDDVYIGSEGRMQPSRNGNSLSQKYDVRFKASWVRGSRVNGGVSWLGLGVSLPFSTFWPWSPTLLADHWTNRVGVECVLNGTEPSLSESSL